MSPKKVETAVNEALANNGAFLVDLEISEGNKIGVFVDTDKGILINELKMINRQIEAALDRDEEDFALTVSSPGLDRPFKVKRQYANNIGRWVKVKTVQGEKCKGKLLAATESDFIIEMDGAKKKDPKISKSIAFDDVEETKIEIRF